MSNPIPKPAGKKPNPVLRKEQLGDRLYIAHLRGGGRSYRTDYRFTKPDGTTTWRTHTYARVELLTRDEVREQHERFLKRIAGPGAVDPSLETQAARAERAGNFEAKCRAWNARRVEAKQISALQGERVIEVMEKHVFPVIGERNLASITTPDLFNLCESITKGDPIRVGDKIVERAPAPSVPVLVRSWVRLMYLDAANRDTAITFNPATNLVVTKHRGKSHARVGVERLPQFFRDLAAYGARPRVKRQTVLALRLMVHWAVRVSTLARMQWSFVDEVRDMVRVPARNMKDCDRLTDPKFGDFLIPLTAETRAILAELREDAGPGATFMFPSRSKLGATIAPQALLQALKYMGWSGKGDTSSESWRPNATVHGFRSTFKTHAAAQWKKTEVDADALHYQFDHSNDNEVDARYVHDDDGGQRALNLPERFALMAWWSAFVAECERPRDPVRLRLVA